MPLLAFEGLDQSGKETQARTLRAALERAGRTVETLTFPSDETPIGHQIRTTLDGGHEFPPDVMQLLFIANRHEHRPRMEQWLAHDVVVICDRYLASSVAYGEAFGLDALWLEETQRLLPQPALTILLDIAPETALARKHAGRDRYERDLALLARVRDSYRRQAARHEWALIDGERSREAVAADISDVVRSRLALL
jgi:dTMP kinase